MNPENFSPYIKTLPIRGCPLRFLFATPQAREWYDPLKPYALIEYEWVVENIPLKNARIVDGGGHHGQYAALFGVASGRTAQIVTIDPNPSNCAIIEANLSLNQVNAEILCAAISQIDGTVCFSGESNGHIVATGGVEVPSRRLPNVMKDPTVVKLDVEGAEFWILPDCIDAMTSVNVWIVEVHPSATRDARGLVQLFSDRGWTLLWVNRAVGHVEVYPADADWSTHTTVFAMRG